MNKPPTIKPGSWIVVDKHDCVVTVVYQESSPFGVCLAVYNKEKPTTRDVDWDGEKWFFPARSDYGGYGEKHGPYI